MSPPATVSLPASLPAAGSSPGTMPSGNRAIPGNRAVPGNRVVPGAMSSSAGGRQRPRKSSSRSSGQVLITSSAVSQPRCATPTPNRWPASPGTEWASLSMENLTP